MHYNGVKVITLLALSDRGTPCYDKELGKEISKLGIACFACSPDKLPDLVAVALKRQNLLQFERK